MTRPAIHAGEILSDELEELGISASELARSLHIPTNRITQILKGQRGITADTALRLGRWFGYWFRQVRYKKVYLKPVKRHIE